MKIWRAEGSDQVCRFEELRGVARCVDLESFGEITRCVNLES